MTIEVRTELVIRAEDVLSEAASDPARGRLSAEVLITAARDAGDAEALVIALRAAGYAARELYEHDDARRLLDEAVAVARAARLSDRLCEALITRSAMQIELGRPQHARRDVIDAREAASPRLVAEVEFADGLLSDKTGDFTAAADAYRRALASLDGSPSALRVKTLNNFALTVARFGRHAQAERLLEEAISLAGSRWKARRGVATESYAMVAVDAGRPVEALRRYERAEQLLTEVGVQLVDLYLGKARALFTLRLLDEAAVAASRAVAVVEARVGGSMMLAEALLPAARIALAQERLDEAVSAAQRAERLFQRQRRVGWRAAASLLRLSAQVASGGGDAVTLRSLRRLERTMADIGNRRGQTEAAHLYGEVAAARGNDTAAVAAFERAAQVGRRGTAILRLQGYHAAARAAEITDESRRIGQVCRRGLDELANYQATFASVELRTRAAAHGRVLAQIGLRCALRSGRGEQIWNWIERGHATAFVGGSAPSDERLQELLAKRRADERALLDLPPDAASERADVLRRIRDAERRIRSASWTLTGGPDDLTAPSVRSMRELRAELGDRILVQYGVIDGEIHGVAVADRGFRHRRLGSIDDVRAAGQHLAFALRRLAQPRSAGGVRAAFASAYESLDRLRDQLVDPFGDLVPGVAEIVVVAQNQLMAVPWGVLGPLADRPVCVAPSATAWRRSTRREPAGESVVLVGGPDVDHGRPEVEELAAIHGRARVLVDPDASCAEVRRAASGAHLVHVAAHGTLRADSPTFSSLVLSDGSLTLHDLDQMDAPAHHWVLAACDLGRPGTLAGAELEGVVATALAGGTGALVAAGVAVPDLSTRRLMVELHSCLAEGRSPAEALWTARRAVDADDPTDFATSVAFSCYGGG